MKVIKTQITKTDNPHETIDMFVDEGYLQGASGSLPDVDTDFESTRRQEVKEYLERRYNHNGKQRVFSAGTFTTLKIKAVLKDVCRTHRIPPSIVNYITAIFDDKCDWTGAFILAYQTPKIKKFIQEHPDVFEEIRTLMGQPRSSSVHASALIVTPDDKDGKDMECFDFIPIKKVDGMLVSEIDGYSIDEIGLLKNDVLGIKELSKLHDIINLCNNEYDAHISFEDIVRSNLDDEKVYSLLQNGFTQNVFQFGSKGMTKFLMDMKPSCIDDMIAANALFRPATIESGSLDAYVDCKNGDSPVTFLWGTENSMKDTFGQLVYQEQLAQIAREVGGFSLGEGVKLVKFISKKKVDKIQSMKHKFMDGAKKNGCPKDDADKIWHMMEAGGTYLFNKSHATAYAVTAYVGAWLKANYPSAFYTVALEWADSDEISSIMSEMEQCSNAKVVCPDINLSEVRFHTDFQNNQIYWSMAKIKQVGVKAVDWIVEERTKNGDYTSIENFIHRVFKYKLKKYEYWDDPENEEEIKRCPVTARHVLNLILSGCFDNIEGAKSLVERYTIVNKAAATLGFELKPKDFPEDLIDKHYFWGQKQIEVSGIGKIDYRRAYDNSEAKAKIKGRASYKTLADAMSDEMDGKKIGFCATVIEVEEKKYNDKRTHTDKLFCKIMLQQNNDVMELIIWNDEYAGIRGTIMDSKNKLVVGMAQVKFSDFTEKNTLQFIKSSCIEVL